LAPIVIETFRWLVLVAVALGLAVLLVAWAGHTRWGKLAATVCAVLALVFAVLGWLNLHP
jgi:hypothetical protein